MAEEIYSKGLPVFKKVHYFFPKTIEFVDKKGNTRRLVSTKEFVEDIEKQSGEKVQMVDFLRGIQNFPHIAKKMYNDSEIYDIRLRNESEKREDFYESHVGKKAIGTTNKCKMKILSNTIFLDKDNNCSNTKMKIEYLENCGNNKKGETDMYPYEACHLKVEDNGEYFCPDDNKFLICSIPTTSDGRCLADKKQCKAEKIIEETNIS